MVIGARQLGLAILMHDAAHGLLFANRRLNEWTATWLCASPVFTSLTLYRPYHLTHHRHTQQAEDPDLGLSAALPVTRASLWRKIARDLGVARDTVQTVLRRWQAERAGQGGDTAKSSRRPSLVDPFNAAILQLLARYPDITSTRVFEELRAQGFRGGMSIVRERVMELRPQPQREPVVRFETPPGH